MSLRQPAVVGCSRIKGGLKCPPFFFMDAYGFYGCQIARIGV
jgi:hypothetical protein